MPPFGLSYPIAANVCHCVGAQCNRQPVRVLLGAVCLVLVILWVLPGGTSLFAGLQKSSKSPVVLEAVGQQQPFDSSPADFFAPGEELLIACIGDSITFGDASHETNRKRERRKGNYPMMFRQHVADRLGPNSSSLVVYNFGVGSKAVAHRHNYSNAITPEYAAAKTLLRDALEYKADANGSLAPAHAFESLSGRLFRAGAAVSANVTAARRTVLLVVKMGTNDCLDPVWRTLSEDGRSMLSGGSASSAFAAEYLRMVRGLVPEGGVAEGVGSIVNITHRIRLVVVFVSPIPVFPDAGISALFERIFSGLRIATDIRSGVHLAAREASRNLSLALLGPPVDASVHFFDLFAPFMDYVASLKGDAPVKPSELAWLRRAFPLSGPSLAANETEYRRRVIGALGRSRIKRALYDSVHPSLAGNAFIAKSLHDWLSVGYRRP